MVPESLSINNNNDRYKNTDKFIYILFGSYFVLQPFYLWKSGLPQISDIIIIFALITFLLINKMTLRVQVENLPIIKSGFLFVAYITLINLIWIFILSDLKSFGQVSLYYIFNFILFVLFTSLYAQYETKIYLIIYRSVSISIYMQLIIFIINGGYTGTRLVGTFNNPNQLGYYALATTTILIYLTQKIKVKSGWFILSLISTSLLIISSLSATAIASYILLIFIFILLETKNIKMKRNFLIILFTVIIIILYLHFYTTFFEESKMILGLRTRLNRVPSKTESLVMERGYNRIIEYPQYWFFGAGEGAYLERFGSRLELHSLFGNIQVSYGLVGVSLFMKFLLLTVRENTINKILLLLPMLVYGITHNSIRSGFFWILLGLFSV